MNSSTAFGAGRARHLTGTYPPLSKCHLFSSIDRSLWQFGKYDKVVIIIRYLHQGTWFCGSAHTWRGWCPDSSSSPCLYGLWCFARHMCLVTRHRCPPPMEIDIFKQIQVIGCHKCQGFLGLHNFSGAGWVNAYLKLDDDDQVINHFKDLCKGSIPPKLIIGELPSKLQSLEHFACHVYSSKCPTTLRLLRWELFLSKNLEGEMLPPT